MNKFILTCALLIISQVIFGQKKSPEIWYLTVVDSTTSIGIERVTISSNNTNNFFTNESGVVLITKSMIKNKDVKISCIGYKTLILQLNYKYPDTLRLISSIKTLNEVTINGSNKKIILGDSEKPFKSGYYPGWNQEIAEYIPNSNKVTGIITNIECALLSGQKGIKKPFKVNLYAKKKDDIYPNEALIKDSIVVDNPKGLEKVSVDISKYNILFPEDGVFVSFQILSPSRYNNETVRLHGHDFAKVPGIKGVWTNGQVNDGVSIGVEGEEKIQPGLKYSLIRTIETSDWVKFAYGTDFAIGITLEPQ